jgi:hypothetical protein
VPRNESGTPRSELVPAYVEKEWKSALEQARRVAYRIFELIKKRRPLMPTNTHIPPTLVDEASRVRCRNHHAWCVLGPGLGF